MIRQSAAVLFFVFAYSAFGALSVRDCGVREGLFGVDVRANTEAIAKAVERCAAESPIACLAAVHTAAATRNFMALELHSVDVPWWGDLVKPALSYKGGFIKVPMKPGLGIDELNEKLIKKQACADFPPP